MGPLLGISNNHEMSAVGQRRDIVPLCRQRVFP